MNTPFHLLTRSQFMLSFLELPALQNLITEPKVVSMAKAQALLTSILMVINSISGSDTDYLDQGFFGFYPVQSKSLFFNNNNNNNNNNNYYYYYY
jgi:hypothetical protein